MYCAKYPDEKSAVWYTILSYHNATLRINCRKTHFKRTAQCLVFSLYIGIIKDVYNVEFACKCTNTIPETKL